MSTVIRFKRGTLAQLVAAASAAGLREGEPYHITDLDMNAIGLSTTTYRFDGVLQLDGSEPVPTGYIGAVSRPGSFATVAATGDYNDLNNLPSLAAVATSGAYSDLSGTPTIVALTNSTPAGLGTAAVGTSSDAARADHVHAKSSVYTYGTASPTGGADGDLYIQHT
jgi:hypothetical protein